MESQKGRDAVVQRALLPSHSPLEKTPHKTRVISIALMAALITLLKMTTQKSSATDLDCCHYTVLRV